MEGELVVRESKQIIKSMEDAEKAAKAMAGSGFFQDSKSAAQAVVKILAGMELGFGPFASMTGVHIIQGKPSIGANLMAAAVKGSGKYNYRVVEMSDMVCVLDFFEGKEKIGTSRFTIEDAKKAELTGKDTWKKYAKNLLFARAMSNGVRWYCPDIFNGAPVYTPEEMGAEVDEEGNVLKEPENITPEVKEIIEMDSVVEKVEQRKGATDGKRWTKYFITAGGHILTTFDKKIAEAAKKSAEKHIIATINYKVTQYGNEIVAIDVSEKVESPEPIVAAGGLL